MRALLGTPALRHPRADLSSTVAKVRPVSLRRSGAGVMRLTTTRTTAQTTNMKMAIEIGQVRRNRALSVLVRDRLVREGGRRS
jgi:hypothetical protein